MNKLSWRIYFGFIIASVLLVFINYRYTTGFILGAIVSIILFYRNDQYWNEVLDDRYQNKMSSMFHFVINYGLMAVSLLVCAILQQYFNIIFCAIGLMAVKWAIVFATIVKRK